MRGRDTEAGDGDEDKRVFRGWNITHVDMMGEMLHSTVVMFGKIQIYRNSNIYFINWKTCYMAEIVCVLVMLYLKNRIFVF